MTLIDKRDLALLKEKFSGQALEKAVELVRSGEPLAYVLGEWYFYGLTFKLNKACLIPRPDTEHVVEAAINTVKKGGRFIDLCTGSGCIAISVLKNRPDLTAYALEISAKALEMAKKNAEASGVSDRLTFIEANVFDFDPASLPGLDAVISNPPYIRSEVVPTLEVSKSEPITALDGGSDGLDFYKHIMSAYKGVSENGGCFIFEIGYDQGSDLTALSQSYGMSCEIRKDYGGNDRVALLH